MFKLIILAALAVSSLLCLSACEEVDVKEVAGERTLEFDFYRDEVNPIFDKMIADRSCSASGCHDVHSGSGGAFKIYPNTTDLAELTANFYSAKAFANLSEPERSKLLLEPLTGTFSIVGSHAGGNLFTDTSDPDYQTILTWIRDYQVVL